MKASEMKPGMRSDVASPPRQALAPEDDELDIVPVETLAHTQREFVPDAWYPSVWDALIGYWGYVDPERSFVPEPKGRWLLDEDDFSSEHGYEPGAEGRSEFEHGEFERWL